MSQSPGDGEQLRVRVGEQELYLAPSSQSAARTAAALPAEPSEDASNVLGTIEVPSRAMELGDRDYLPSESTEWVVTVQISGKPRLEPEKITNLFGREWAETFGSMTTYGRDADTGRWTFLISANGPVGVTDLKFSWDYVDPVDEHAPRADAPIFERRLKALEQKLAPFGRATFAASLLPLKAAARVKELASLKSTLDHSAVLMLKAPPGKRFDGKEVWDVMLCLGLSWGDMDCFHWINPSQLGDDYFFSVETSTMPGYFLPEEIAAGRVHVEDLVFTYSVPRCAKPAEVFDGMVRAAEYCKKRLGGEIQNEQRRPAKYSDLRSQIVEIERQLRQADVPPGSEGAMRLF